MLCLFDVLVHPSYCAIYLSLRSMWSLKPQSKIVVIRRGFLKPVSIATHLSSWALLPSYPLCHTASLSSSPCPITVSELRRYGHGVDPLWLLLSLQSVREIKPAWVCFLSVVSLSIWLSASLLYLSNRHSHDRNLFLPDHMLYPTPWLFCVFLFFLLAFSEHFVALFVFRLSGPHVGCEIMRRETAEREQARDWDRQSLWIRVVTAERF